jgi:hypothetical protein
VLTVFPAQNLEQHEVDAYILVFNLQNRLLGKKFSLSTPLRHKEKMQSCTHSRQQTEVSSELHASATLPQATNPVTR